LYNEALNLNQDSSFPVWISGTSAVSFFGIESLQNLDLSNLKEVLEFTEEFKVIKS